MRFSVGLVLPDEFDDVLLRRAGGRSRGWSASVMSQFEFWWFCGIKPVKGKA
jgi:hypothetical protein